jgi:hypothetical protein
MLDKGPWSADKSREKCLGIAHRGNTGAMLPGSKAHSKHTAREIEAILNE